MEEVFADWEKEPGWKEGYAKAEFEVSLSIRIGQARVRAGLSQSQLAEVVGTTQSVISRIEAANQNMTIDTLYKIAKALNCELVVELRSAPKKEKHETASQVNDAPLRERKRRIRSAGLARRGAGSRAR
jgi:transcriptional regulator with XRE-family HTH domain